jgi:hypothetical protein
VESWNIEHDLAGRMSTVDKNRDAARATRGDHIGERHKKRSARCDVIKDDDFRTGRQGSCDGFEALLRIGIRESQFG